MSVQSDDPSTNNQQQQQPNNGQPGGTVEQQAPDDLDTLRAEVTEIAQRADEYLRLAQRTQADFVNYRRRIEEERAQQAREATVGLLQRLLPVLDDFERTMANASETERQSGWGQGVQLVERNLRNLLNSEGVDRIETDEAEFDPRLHEAVGSQPSGDVPEGHVLHVVRQGYRKGDRILRPAQVIVASRPDGD